MYAKILKTSNYEVTFKSVFDAETCEHVIV